MMTPVNPTDAQAQVKSYVDMHWDDPNPIFSVVIDADMLRDYLNSTMPNAKGQTGTQVTQLKFIFAHQLDYCQSLIAGPKPPHATPEKLSFVLLGFDNTGTYVLNKDNMVYDQMNPCPTECPPLGQASCTYLKLNDTDSCNPS